MKIDMALYSNEKRHRQLWYFIVDRILSIINHGLYGSRINERAEKRVHFGSQN